MMIKGRVLQCGLMEKRNEKDQQKGLRFLIIVRQEIQKTFGDKTYGEFLIWQIKTVDNPDLDVDGRYAIDGALWEMKDNSGNTIRGFSNVTFEKLADDARED